MNLLMISGDRSLASGKQGAFWQTLEELRKHWERIDVLCPYSRDGRRKKKDDSSVESFRFFSSPSRRRALDAEVSLRAEGPLPTAVFPNVFLHPSPNNLWYQPLWILRKGKELSRQRQYNVMTVHDYPPFYNGMGAWMLHRSTGIPWVSEIHHVVGYPCSANMQESIGQLLYGPYFKTIARSAIAFRVVNAGACDLLETLGAKRERIHVIPSFYLDHSLLQPDPTIQKNYDIVFCGRLVANKGVRELLKAVHNLALRPLDYARGDTSIHLLVIGDGSLRAKMEAPLPRGEGRSAVTFTGWLPSLQEVYRAMQSAKIFVMCSKSEGGPRVVLEAMALGLPVIATSVGVVPDVMRDGENGLITTGTPEDLAQKIGRLLEDEPLRRGLGQRARDILQLFERRKLIREYAEFLQSFSYRIPSP